MTKVRYFYQNDPDFKFVKSIRKTVFVYEQGIKEKKEFDKYDNNAIFAVLFENKTPIATARCLEVKNGFKIGRIAVLKAYRGKGYGRIIVNDLCKRAFIKGGKYVYVDAQLDAVPFYEKLGFKVNGSEITDRGLPHIPMVLEGNNDEQQQQQQQQEQQEQ